MDQEGDRGDDAINGVAIELVGGGRDARAICGGATKAVYGGTPQNCPLNKPDKFTLYFIFRKRVHFAFKETKQLELGVWS